MRKTDGELLEEDQHILDKLRANGTMSSIFAKYGIEWKSPDRTPLPRVGPGVGRVDLMLLRDSVMPRKLKSSRAKAGEVTGQKRHYGTGEKYLRQSDKI